MTLNLNIVRSKVLSYFWVVLAMQQVSDKEDLKFLFYKIRSSQNVNRFIEKVREVFRHGECLDTSFSFLNANCKEQKKLLTSVC